MATRLQSCIKEVVHTDQNGFIARRYIGANLRAVQDVIDETSWRNEETFILALDFKNAFDMVRWATINKALEWFNFGESFRDSVATIFRGIETCVSNAGYTSEYFAPSNGVRQGCCVSPLLFIITAELLGIMIRKNNLIEGVSVRNIEYKISQFADDTTCFVKNTTSLHAVKDTLALFATFSGLHLNLDKCAILPLGPQTHPPSDIGNIKVVSKAKILGILFSKERSQQDHFVWNFGPQLDKMRACCRSWNNKTLSLKGKVTVYNSLIVSLLQYVCTNTVTRPRVTQEVKKIACSFVWSNKKNKVAYNSLIQAIPDGGLKLVDLPARIEVSLLGWIRRALQTPESSSAEMIKNLLRDDDIFGALAAKQPTEKSLWARSPFYSEVLTIWHSVHCHPPSDEAGVRAEVLWDNVFIS